MIKYRPHRGSLADSMAEMKEFNDVEGMLDYVYEQCGGFKYAYPRRGLGIDTYSNEPDERIGWAKTYVIKHEGHGVMGFCDSIGEAR